MHRALGLLILAAEGALAQSREPSHWDANVAAAFNVNGCPCNSTAHDCRPDNGATMKQSEMNELKVTYMTEVPLKFAYLTDQDGTILDYHTKGWETGSEEGNLVKFTWDASMQPTRLVPHIVYENSCADVFPSVAVQTWRTALALLSEEYDVGNSPEESPSRPPSPPAPPPSPPAPPPSPQLPVNAPPVTPPPAPVSTPLPLGTPTIDVNSDIVLGDDWFNGGEAKASFPDARDSIPAGRNAMWLQNQDGTIIYYELSESADAAGLDFQQRPFPRGTLDLHACRLFPTTKLCATENIRDKYITKVEEISSPASVGAYTSSNKPFTDVFTGHFDPGPKADQDKGKPGRTSIGPKSGSDCTKKNATGHPLTDADGKKLAMEYVIYAKELNADGVEESNAAVLGFAFDKALHFDGTTATKFKVYLTCCTKRKCSGSGTGSGLTLTTGTMDLNVFLGPTTYSVLGPDDYEKQADAPRCHDHDGHDHAEGAEEEEEEGHPSDNTTWFKHEGRDCMCDMGTLKCKRAGAGSPFSMNEGETVGLVIAVSAIVFICIGAIFFFGYSAMLKRKARDTGVVLQSDGDRL